MKKIIPVFLLLLLAVTVQVKAQKITDFPDIGEPIMADYPNVEWIKGTPLTHFDKDKIYVIELWATWCIPCVAAMPHLNALNLKFKNKGVVIVGQNVMEANKAKVEAFVKLRGDGLSYNIAYSGAPGSDFDIKWLKPAFVNAIPQTFIIQNNKLVWQTHPMNLNEKILQLLVDGKFTIDAAKALEDKQ